MMKAIINARHNLDLSRTAWRSRLMASGFALLAAGVAAGGPLTDPFQTDGVLEAHTQGVVDPHGHDCPLPQGVLSFAAAVDLALCRNPQTRSAWDLARQQAAALGSAESAWLPNASATASQG